MTPGELGEFVPGADAAGGVLDVGAERLVLCLARASLVLMPAAVAILLAVAGWHSLTLITFAAIGACAVVAGVSLRWLALVLVIAAPVVILVTSTPAGLAWAAILMVALMLASAGAARTALGTDGHKAVPAISPAVPRRHPFLIMNPRSAGARPPRSSWRRKPRRWAPRWSCCRARAGGCVGAGPQGGGGRR